jgi:lipoprotein-releasing system permease protein
MPPDFPARDPGFARIVGIDTATFSTEPGIFIGAEAARRLALRKGDFISILAPSSTSDRGLSIVRTRIAIGASFTSGYYEFDSGLALLSLASAAALMKAEPMLHTIYGIKLLNLYRDADFVSAANYMLLSNKKTGLRIEGWRDYNRSFFGALRTEKTLMLFLVGLIFIVVGVNIYHAMRRTVAMRMEDLAVLRALGAGAAEIRAVFAVDGSIVGFAGVMFGLTCGLFVAENINGILGFQQLLSHWIDDGFGLLFNGNAFKVPIRSSPLFYMQEIPVRVLLPETLLVSFIAAGAAVFASVAASRQASRLEPAEILRYE